MIQFVCPGVVTSRIRLPQDDASWHWAPGGELGRTMRVYFETAARTLRERLGHPVGQDAYVSVSRHHAFLGRPVVEAYLRAWLRRLGLDDSGATFDFGGPSAAIELSAGPVAGQLLLDDEAGTDDLLQFAGLDGVLAELGHFVRLDPEEPPQDGSGVFADGVYIQLACLASR